MAAVNYIIIHVVGRPENTVGLTFHLMDWSFHNDTAGCNIAEGIFFFLLNTVERSIAVAF